MSLPIGDELVQKTNDLVCADNTYEGVYRPIQNVPTVRWDCHYNPEGHRARRVTLMETGRIYGIEAVICDGCGGLVVRDDERQVG